MAKQPPTQTRVTVPAYTDKGTFILADFQPVIGLEAENASALLAESGWIMRIVRVNKQAATISNDVISNRVNVAIENNRVQAIVSKG